MNVIVGTAGHIDHGKTALVKALTGTDADRLPEEKRRGITVDLGFAEMTVGDKHFGFVDVPGHEKFVRNMLAGASGIDVVLLVVAADEGVMPQTREHFEICRLLDIRSGIVALTKSDLVDEETLELAKLDVAQLIAGSFLENAPMIAVSSKSGDGIDDLITALVTQTSAAVADRHADAMIAFLPIDRSFTIKGFGTVITGTLHSGKLDTTSQLELLPERRRVRVRGLQTHGSSTEAAHAGQRVAVNLAGIDHEELARGMLIVEADTLSPTQVIDAEIEMLEEAPRALRSRARVRVHIGTAEILARVHVLNDKGEIEPGERNFAQVRLESSTAVVPGERFIIRSYSPQVTVGGGVVLDNAAERHRRREFDTVRVDLTEMRDALGDPARMISSLVAAAGANGIDTKTLMSRTGFRRDVIETSITHLGDGVVNAGVRWVEKTSYERMKAAMIDRLTEAHRSDPLAKGVSREALAAKRFTFVPDAVIVSLLESLQLDGSVVIDGELVRLASYGTTLSADEQTFTERLFALYRDAKLEVPKIAEATTGASVGLKLTQQTIVKLVRLAIDDGKILKVTEEFYFDAETIAALINVMRERLSSEFDVSAFKDLAGVSRKYAIPLLEYLDRTHVTARVGDKRIVIK